MSVIGSWFASPPPDAAIEIAEEAVSVAVLGARGSQLQLVLNTVFHLETSPGNIPWTLYEEFRKDPRVELAIPYAVGDSYRGFRIVGTLPSIFEVEHARGRRPAVATGRLFDPERREAVLGSFVAATTGLRVNDRFHPTHGTAEEGHEHEDEYEDESKKQPKM